MVASPADWSVKLLYMYYVYAHMPMMPTYTMFIIQLWHILCGSLFVKSNDLIINIILTSSSITNCISNAFLLYYNRLTQNFEMNARAFKFGALQLSIRMPSIYHRAFYCKIRSWEVKHPARSITKPQWNLAF